MGEVVIALLAVGLALAQDPPPLEVTVWGEAAVRQARAAVVREAREAGWKKVREKDGVVILKPPQAWMGRALLDYDGTLSFRRPVVVFNGAQLQNPVGYGENPHFDRDPGGMNYGDEGWAAPQLQGRFFILPRRGILDPVHQRLRDRLEPSLDEYHRVVELTAERD